MSLWLVGAQGNNPRAIYRLGVGSGGLDWPTWSPDGKKIAFTAYPAGPYRPPQIFVLTVATGAVVQLTELKDGAFDPAWSPDGSAIALAGRSEGRTNLIVMKADGSGQLRLTDGRAERAPTWSPDGSEIAYLALNGRLLRRLGGPPAGQRGLGAARADQQAERRRRLGGLLD